MPRTIQLHPLSLLVGVSFALLGVVVMGQAPAAKRHAAAHDSGLLQVAHPRDWIRIDGGTSYTVPQGKLLVITALGCYHGATTQAWLTFDGSSVVSAAVDITHNGTTVKEVPIGLRASPGTVVDVMCSAPQADGRAWGYLVDA